jgi:hypothetical protein
MVNVILHLEVVAHTPKSSTSVQRRRETYVGHRAAESLHVGSWRRPLDAYRRCLWDNSAGDIYNATHTIRCGILIERHHAMDVRCRTRVRQTIESYTICLSQTLPAGPDTLLTPASSDRRMHVPEIYMRPSAGNRAIATPDNTCADLCIP